MPVSKENVRELVKSTLENYRFIIVSNREPYMHVHAPQGVKCKTPAGGLTAALDPLMQACGGTWVAGGAGDADRESVDEHNRCLIPPDDPKYTLKRVWMTKDEVDKFYFGFSNQTLWPLCHSVFKKPLFREDFWKGYQYSNNLFAKSTLEEIGNEPAFIWFQDYHFALTPEIVRKMLPKGQKIVLAQFWHIPWPPFETMVVCPWAKEILKGLLANDLIGFHIREFCLNFIECAEKILGADVNYKDSTISFEGRRIKVKEFPISIDFNTIDKIASNKQVEDEAKKIRSSESFPYRHIAVGVDRVDYTKGIIERLLAIDRFLEKYPMHQNNFVYIEAGAPSRTRIPAYMELTENIHELTEEINWKYQKGYWKPIHLIEKKINYERLLALYRTADVCIVSSLHDGMNLVAKEFIAANVDCTGVLILSPFAGAAEELKDSLIVNPYDIERFADAIKKALELSPKEKKKRVENLRKIVKKNNIYKWLADFITEVGKVL